MSRHMGGYEYLISIPLTELLEINAALHSLVEEERKAADKEIAAAKRRR